MISDIVQSTYGNKVRVRVCGILIKNSKILVLNHFGLNKENEFWSPPGGGIEFGESIETCLKREFQEEVNIKIESLKFLFINEHINKPLHAIELFYSVESQDVPSLDSDPEIPNSLQKMKWMCQKELNSLHKNVKHSIFNQNPSIIQYIIEKR